MQTFLPTSPTELFPLAQQHLGSWALTAENIAVTLDNKRLHKQALESWQILMCLLQLDPDGNYRKPKGWVNHPAVKMWRGYEPALVIYIQAMITEWKRRGFKSSLTEKLNITVRFGKGKGLLPIVSLDSYYTTEHLPPWMIDKDEVKLITHSHRMALLNKNYEHYNQFNWPEDSGIKIPSYEYHWPVNEKEKVMV
jgi:hypothetical protein